MAIQTHARYEKEGSVHPHKHCGGGKYYYYHSKLIYIYIRDLGPSQIILITNLTPSNEKTVKGLKTEQLRNCCIPLKNVPQSNPLPVLNTENETGSF